MLTFGAACIFAFCIWITFHNGKELSLMNLIFVFFAGTTSGGFVIGLLSGHQDERALLYSIVATMAALMYNSLKVFYEVTPEKVRK